MGQFCSCFKSTSIFPIKEETNSPIMNIARYQLNNSSVGVGKYNSFDEDPKSPGSVMSNSPRSESRSPYPDLRIKIPIDKEIYFDDNDKTLGAKRHDNYHNKRYKKNRLC
jgi:hypothetical protein